MSSPTWALREYGARWMRSRKMGREARRWRNMFGYFSFNEHEER